MSLMYNLNMVKNVKKFMTYVAALAEYGIVAMQQYLLHRYVLCNDTTRNSIETKPVILYVQCDKLHVSYKSQANQAIKLASCSN